MRSKVSVVTLALEILVVLSCISQLTIEAEDKSVLDGAPVILTSSYLGDGPYLQFKLRKIFHSRN